MRSAQAGIDRPWREIIAADPAHSRGRRHPEPPSPTRTAFQRDADRIVHATAFRRLKDKTQVFLYDEGDHYRTRLTHTLEVSRIARAMARTLGADEDLAEAIALAHDLGHPPFGHAGERALDAAMRETGGFDHNVQSLRVVARLERRYPAFDGLNLTWEVLEGLAKHNGPLLDARGARLGGADPEAVAALAGLDLGLRGHAGIEAQIAAIADDIAYDAHDIDDGLRAGLLDLEGLARLELVGDLLRGIAVDHPELRPPRLVHELTRRLITRLIDEAMAETTRRLDALAPAAPDDVRRAGRPMVAFPAAVAAAEGGLKAHLSRHVWRHETVAGVMAEAESVVARLFARYRENAAALPPEWRPAPGATDVEGARQVADFLAGMTDRFALAEYVRLFDETPDFV